MLSNESSSGLLKIFELPGEISVPKLDADVMFLGTKEAEVKNSP